MEIREIGSRGLLFTYYDLGIATNVYVIVSEEKYFIVDTYLGADIMREIDQYLVDRFGKKANIIINSHSDWDHIWGNSYYKKYTIISHSLCREEIRQNGDFYLEKYKDFIRGSVEIELPNLVFEERIEFPREEVQIFYTPGHTRDSISVYDAKDKVLLVGDNVEGPIPYIQSSDLVTYIETLNKYLDMEANVVIGGHTPIEDMDIVRSNRKYLLDILNKRDFSGESQELMEIHEENMKFLEENL